MFLELFVIVEPTRKRLAAEKEQEKARKDQREPIVTPESAECCLTTDGRDPTGDFASLDGLVRRRFRAGNSSRGVNWRSSLF